MSTKRFGILLSSCSQLVADDPVIGSYRTMGEAAARANRILEAQPGLAMVLVVKQRVGAEWRGLDGLETMVEIVRRLWR